MSDLEAANLPLQDEKLLGFEDFVKQYREADPGAFAARTSRRRLSPYPVRDARRKSQANSSWTKSTKTIHSTTRKENNLWQSNMVL